MARGIAISLLSLAASICAQPQLVELRIVDAGTGGPVRAARVVFPAKRSADPHPWFFEATPAMPGVGPADGSLVVELESSRTAYVGAPGYAWSQLWLNPSANAPIEVKLQRAGTVDLSVDGWSAEGPYVLYLERREPTADCQLGPGERAVVPRPDRSGRQHLPGVPEGTYTATLRVGFWVSNGAVHDSATIQVRHDAPCALRLGAKTHALPVKLSVTVSHPGGWTRSDPFKAVLTGTGELTRGILQTASVPVEAGRHELVFEHVLAGAYALSIDDIGWTVPLDAASAGGTHDFEIPARTEVGIPVIDDETGFEVAARAIGWTPARGGENAVPPSQDSAYRTTWSQAFEAVPGSYWIRCDLPGYQPATTRITAGGSPYERREVRVKRAGQGPWPGEKPIAVALLETTASKYRLTSGGTLCDMLDVQPASPDEARDAGTDRVHARFKEKSGYPLDPLVDFIADLERSHPRLVVESVDFGSSDVGDAPDGPRIWRPVRLVASITPPRASLASPASATGQVIRALAGAVPALASLGTGVDIPRLRVSAAEARFPMYATERATLDEIPAALRNIPCVREVAATEPRRYRNGWFIEETCVVFR